jgi:cation-dependent mannose-6-phosphate receptor
MYLISLQTIVLAALVLQKGLTVSAAEEQKQQPPCTIRVQKSGYFFDLRSLSLSPQDEDKHTEDEKAERLRNINGHDYPANFTMNICASVKGLEDVVGVDKSLWANVSAYYEHSGKKYSIGYVPAEIRPIEVEKRG